MTKRHMVHSILQDRPKQPGAAESQAFAPANIALCKYWGKRNTELNLPVTSSLSLSLGHRGTHIKLRVMDRNEGKGIRGDMVTVIHQDSSPILHAEQAQSHKTPCPAQSDKSNHPLGAQITAFLHLFRADPSMCFHIIIRNSIPVAVGLASSASMFAALVKSLNTLFAWKLSKRELSILARLGSGSACRSMHKGFVQWHAGTADDGMDSWGEPLRATWPDLLLGLVIVSKTPKTVSSREAMQRTVTTSELYGMWPAQAEKDLKTLHRAIHDKNFLTLGQTSESNALAMHATMLGASPPVLYWLPQSIHVMQQVWQARHDGIPVYWTTDAGPNVKLLFQKQHQALVQQRFPTMQVVDPWRTCPNAFEATVPSIKSSSL